MELIARGAGIRAKTSNIRPKAKYINVSPSGTGVAAVADSTGGLTKYPGENRCWPEFASDECKTN